MTKQLEKALVAAAKKQKEIAEHAKRVSEEIAAKSQPKTNPPTKTDEL